METETIPTSDDAAQCADRGLGPRGRRFKACRPDLDETTGYVESGNGNPQPGIHSGILPDKLPFNLLTAEQLSPKIGLTVARITELAASGHMPHHWFDGAGPFYKQFECEQWAKKNLKRSVPGMPLPTSLGLCIAPVEAAPGTIPAELSSLTGLQAFPEIPCFPTAIYFLIKRREIVYVGQSTNLLARILTHVKEKQFDGVLFLPCPLTELDAMEGAFIRLLKPPLNGAGPVVEPAYMDRVRQILAKRAAFSPSPPPASKGQGGGGA